MLPEAIIERDRERAAIDRFIVDAKARPSALVLEGPPGIGKSALWSATVRAARASGARVLEARPTEAEAAFAYSALRDLLRDAFDARRGQLPPPQERSLGAALLVVDHVHPIDAGAVATGVLTLIELLAADGPLVLAVDDVHWLDVATRKVLEFVIRRLSGPVGVVASVRPDGLGRVPLGLETAASVGEVQRVTLEPLSMAAVHRLLSDRAAMSLPRPALARVFTTSGGNPYFALELARTIRTAVTRPSSHEPLPLPSSLRDLVAARIEALSPRARDLALLVAASLDPTAAQVRAAMGARTEADLAVAEAETAEVVTFDGGRLRFSHPLLASAVYDSASPADRRTAHQRLSEIVENPEERAVHLSRTVVGIDVAAADRIEAGARDAARRGAQDAAAELYEAACRATPADDRDALGRRLLGSARAKNALGDFAVARAAAERALEIVADRGIRVDLLELVATIEWFNGNADAATRRIEQALELIPDDDERSAAIYARFVRFNFSHDIRRAAAYADAALDRLDERTQPAVFGQVLVDRGFAVALLGDAVAPSDLRRGMDLEESAPNEIDEPQPMPLIWFHCVDEVAAARHRHGWEVAWYRNRGNEVMEADRDSHLAVAELRSGNWEEASRLVALSRSMMDELSARGPLAMVNEKHALVDAFRGATDRARELLVRLVEGFERDHQRWWAALCLSTLAFTEFTAGDDASAAIALVRMRLHAESIGVRDVLFDRSEPLEIDALVRRSEPARAREVLSRLESRGRMLPRRWIDAVLPAARSLVLMAEGDPTAALAIFDDHPARSGPPFEDAWSRLVEGRVRRRGRRKRAAAEALRDAAATFDAIGAPTWAAHARRELDRVGLRRAPAGEMTAGERRVAELAASGLTNREIARAAFMSVKTVEANLARAYGKLGVRTRAELGGRIALEMQEAATET